MRRDELEHAIRAATQIIKDDQVIIIGSQSILGSYTEDQLPPEATMSPEIDIAPMRDADADALSDSAWNRLRPDSLDDKDARTYVFMDSMMDATHAERFLAYMPKLMEAKFPLGPVDLNLERLYSYNNYEGSRFGLGLQTNEKVMRHLSAGGWAGCSCWRSAQPSPSVSSPAGPRTPPRR